MSRQMTLHELADGLFDVSGQDDRVLTGMTADSRALQPGDAFVAVLEGSNFDLCGGALVGTACRLDRGVSPNPVVDW